MGALLTVLFVVLVSLLISRIATVALTLTGISREAARFQARSALSGVGFTTSEAESVVTHPVRRRIVLVLMILGSAGIVTAVATLMLSFAGTSAGEAQLRLAALAVGLFAILLLARSQVVERWLATVIAAALKRWTNIERRDYAELLRLSNDFAVLELAVRPDEWLANQTLAELALRDEGVAVLGIERAEGAYVAAPGWSTEVRPRDTLIVYGPTDRICELDHRPQGTAGDEAHERAVEEHQQQAGHPVVAAAGSPR